MNIHAVRSVSFTMGYGWQVLSVQLPPVLLRRTVVAHNGILSPKLVEPDHRCDTRIAAEEIFPSWFDHLGDEANRSRLAQCIGTFNLLVILTVNPVYDQNA